MTTKSTLGKTLNAISFLTGSTDPSWSKDDTGFNRPDADWFSRTHVSERNLDAAMFRLQKYKRQLLEAGLWFEELAEVGRPADKRYAFVYSAPYFMFEFSDKDRGNFMRTISVMKDMRGRFDPQGPLWRVHQDEVKKNMDRLVELGFEGLRGVQVKEVEPEKREIVVSEKIQGSRQLFSLSFPFDARVKDYIKDLGGFFFDMGDKSWNVSQLPGSNAEKIVKAISFAEVQGYTVVNRAEGKMRDAIRGMELQRERALKAESVKTDYTAKIDLPALGKSPRPYQVAGIRFLDLNDGNCILGDDMGLGKTFQSAAWAIWRKKSVLVVCPNSVKKSWADELTELGGATFQVLDSKTERFEDADFHIINYEAARNKTMLPRLMRELEFDTLIVDEAHKIKDGSTQQAKAVMLLGTKAKSRLCLTGTPIVNAVVDSFNVLHLVAPHLFPSFKRYALKYSEIEKVWTPQGYRDKFYGGKNLDELAREIAPVYLRRTKEEVLKELPEKIISNIYLQGHVEWKSQKTELAQIVVDKSTIAEKKAPYTVEFIENILEQDAGRKIVVFSDYKLPLNIMKEALGDKAVLYTGDLDSEERGVNFDRFIKDPSVNVFLATMAVGGEGINLQVSGADVMIFNDLPWTPKTMLQSEDRLYRMGQKKNVNIYRLMFDSHIEGMILALLEKKMDIIKRAIDPSLTQRELEFSRETMKQSLEEKMGRPVLVKGLKEE